MASAITEAVKDTRTELVAVWRNWPRMPAAMSRQACSDGSKSTHGRNVGPAFTAGGVLKAVMIVQ